MAVFSRWVSVVGGIFLMLHAGTIYLYPAYSADLRKQLDFTQQEADFVGTMLNVGTWLGVIGGFVFDAHGPKVTGTLATTFVGLGYFLFWMGADKQIKHTSTWMGVYALIMGQGSSLMYTVALNTNVQNFARADRGKVVGLLVCFFGLCAGVFSQIKRGFFDTEKSVTPFLQFVNFATVSAAFLGTVLCNVLPTITRTEVRRVHFGYMWAGIVALYLAGISLGETLGDLTPRAVTIVLCALVGVLFCLPAGAGSLLYSRSKPGGKGGDSELLVNDHDDPDANIAAPADLTFLQSWRALDFWLLFLVFGAGIGAGISVLNNIQEIVISRLSSSLEHQTVAHDDLPHRTVGTTCVALFSVCNTFGRLLSGYVTDQLAHRIHRPAWLILSCALMLSVQMYFAFATIDMMLPGAMFLGLAYGSFFCLVPTLTSELFGLRAFGANFGLLGLAPGLGSEVFSTLLAGRMADAEAKSHYVLVKGNGSDSTRHCLGSRCFYESLFINTAACGVAIVAAAWLAYRRRPLRV